MSEKDDTKEQYPLLFFCEETDSLDKAALYKLAWEEAKKAGTLLKKEFGASRVVVFGSVTNPSSFDCNSDIDLAAIGIPDEKFYAAVGAVTNLIREFKVDLVDLNDCRDYLKKEIEKVGIDV